MDGCDRLPSANSAARLQVTQDTPVSKAERFLQTVPTALTCIYLALKNLPTIIKCHSIPPSASTRSAQPELWRVES